MNSIAMVWALWTSVSVTPFTWIPPFRAASNGNDAGARSAAWEVSSSLRERFLGNEAATLVAAFQAYCMLPGRQIGGMCRAVSDGEDEDNAAALSPPRPASAEMGILPPQSGSASAADAAAGGQNSEIREGNGDEDENGEEDFLVHVNLHISPNTSQQSLLFRPAQDSRVMDLPQGVDRYYHSAHFARFSPHCVQAWQDCMWLLTLQEPEAESPATTMNRDGQCPSKHHLLNASSGFITAKILSRLMQDNPFSSGMQKEDDGEGGSIGEQQTEHMGSAPGVVNKTPNSTAFAEYSKEFSILKPFLLYLAVPASAIAMVNASYLNIQEMEILSSSHDEEEKDIPGTSANAEDVQAERNDNAGGGSVHKACVATRRSSSSRQDDGNEEDEDEVDEDFDEQQSARSLKQHQQQQRRCRSRHV